MEHLSSLSQLAILISQLSLVKWRRSDAVAILPKDWKVQGIANCNMKNTDKTRQGKPVGFSKPDAKVVVDIMMDDDRLVGYIRRKVARQMRKRSWSDRQEMRAAVDDAVDDALQKLDLVSLLQQFREQLESKEIPSSSSSGSRQRSESDLSSESLTSLEDTAVPATHKARREDPQSNDVQAKDADMSEECTPLNIFLHNAM